MVIPLLANQDLTPMLSTVHYKFLGLAYKLGKALEQLLRECLLHYFHGLKFTAGFFSPC